MVVERWGNVVSEYWFVVRLPIGYRSVVELDQMVYDTKTAQKLPLYLDGARLPQSTERGIKIDRRWYG